MKKKNGFTLNNSIILLISMLLIFSTASCELTEILDLFNNQTNNDNDNDNNPPTNPDMCDSSICPGPTNINLGDTAQLDITGVNPDATQINWQVKNGPGGGTWNPSGQNQVIENFTPSSAGKYGMSVSYVLYGGDFTCTCDFTIDVIKKPENTLTMSQCMKGAGTGRKILLLLPYSDAIEFQNEFHLPYEYINSTINYIKNKTNIKVSRTFYMDNISNVIDNLESNQYDAVWMFSAGIDPLNEEVSFALSSSEAQQMGDLFRQAAERGVGLAFFGDNWPWFGTINQILEESFPEWGLKLGDDYMNLGRDMLVSKSGPGKIFEHSITSFLGLTSNVFEGITMSNISTPASSINSSFFPILKNSGKTGITVAAVEYDLRVASMASPNAAIKNGKPQLRVVVDGGFTAMFRGQILEEWWIQIPEDALNNTSKFFANMACWNVGAN